MAPSLLDTFRGPGLLRSSARIAAGCALGGVRGLGHLPGAGAARGVQPGVPAGRGGRARVGPRPADAPSTPGSVNDNVMKLVNFKRIVDELEGRKLLVLGGAAFAEALYPHVGFRPVLDIQVLVRRVDVDGFSGYLSSTTSSPEKDDGEQRRCARAVRRPHRHLPLRGRARARAARGAGRHLRPRQAHEGLRPVHLPAGPGGRRAAARAGARAPGLRGAVAVLRGPARAHHRAPRPWAASTRGPWTRRCCRSAPRRGGLERALYTSLSIVARLFPETPGAETAASRRCAAPPGSC